MRIALCAGEASGDQIGAALIQAFKQKYPHCEFVGIAGPQMEAHGCQAIFPMHELDVLGLFEIIKRIPRILKLRTKFLTFLAQYQPDIYIGIDAPDFNLPIERRLRDTGFFTVHYNSPKVWAWRRYRVKKIQKAVDLMLTQFPFEAEFYRPYNVPAVYVGHPFADQIPLLTPVRNNPEPVIGLALGSRKSEIDHHAELFLKTALWCQEKWGACQFVVPMVNEKRFAEFNEIKQRIAPGLTLKIDIGRFRRTIKQCDVVLTAAGTATLEIMLLKKPMVVTYQLSKLTYALGKKLVKIPHVALPNLLANERIVPELIQNDATPEALGLALQMWLESPEKMDALRERYYAIHKQLACNAGKKSVTHIMESYQGKLNEKQQAI